MQMCANIYLHYTLYGLCNTVWVRIKGGYGRTDETGHRRTDKRQRTDDFYFFYETVFAIQIRLLCILIKRGYVLKKTFRAITRLIRVLSFLTKRGYAFWSYDMTKRGYAFWRYEKHFL